MAIVDYPNLTECLSSDGFPVRPDGWFLKFVDTGVIHHRISGAWVDWGMGLSFAPPTKSGRITTNGAGVFNVVFATPFYDDQYSVQLSCQDIGTHKNQPMAFKHNLTANGFSIQTRDSNKGDPMGNIVVSWLATRNFNA